MQKLNKIIHSIKMANKVLEQVDRIKDKHKKEDDRTKSRQEREITSAKSRDESQKERENEREERRKERKGLGEEVTISELIPVGDKPPGVSQEQWKYQSGMVYDPTMDIVRERRTGERLPIGHNAWYNRPLGDIFSTQIQGQRDPNTNTLVEPSLPEIKQTIPGDLDGDGITTPEEWWKYTGQQIEDEPTKFVEP